MTAASILVKVTVILALALLGTRLARHSRAAVRHVLLAASFAALLVLPIASLVVPTVGIAMPAAIHEAIAPLETEPQFETAASSTPPAGAAAGRDNSSRWTWPSLSALLIGGWLAGALVFLLPVNVGLLQVRRLRRSARPWPEGRKVADELALCAGIRRGVDVLIHESIAGPMTCGVWCPAIVLPGDATTWAAEDLRRAIVHELEHVRRADWVSQVLARVVAAVYWFHPIVWVAWRQLALEAERACDDAVLASAPDPAVVYADQLVVLAQRLSTTVNQPHLAMANRSDLATRVVAVLDSRQRRGRAGAVWVGVAALACAILVITISPLRLVAEYLPPPASTPVGQAVPTGKVQRYDAASIKRCEAEENPTGARGTAGGTNATFSPGRFYVPCVTTGQLIYLAYAAYGVAANEHLINDNSGNAADATKVRGGPAWVHSLRDKYSVEATAAGATERTVLMGAMLRTLLEERFKLKIHRDVEEAPMYSLTVAKGGFKLKPMKEGDCIPFDSAAPLEMGLSQLNTAYTTAKMARLEKEVVYNQLKAIGDNQAALEAFPAVLANPTIQAQKAELATLRRNEEEVLQSVDVNHPRARTLRAAMESTQAKIRTEIQNVVKALKTDFEASVAQEKNLGAALQAQRVDPVTPRCGMLNMNLVEGNTVWTFSGMALSNLAGRLSSVLKIHVIDNTNIKDQFVFRFQFPRDPDPLITETGIFAAVEEQLGLKLEKVKAPRGFLVIDAIDRPTPDLPSPFEVPLRARTAGRSER